MSHAEVILKVQLLPLLQQVLACGTSRHQLLIVLTADTPWPAFSAPCDTRWYCAAWQVILHLHSPMYIFRGAYSGPSGFGSQKEYGRPEESR